MNTKNDILYAVQAILPNARVGLIRDEIVIRTGVHADPKDSKGELKAGPCNLPKDRTPAEVGKQSAQELMRALNWTSCESEVAIGFMDVVTREHRTLQQVFGGLLIRAINSFAEMYRAGQYDARNEALCQLCDKLDKQIEFKRLPFI